MFRKCKYILELLKFKTWRKLSDCDNYIKVEHRMTETFALRTWKQLMSKLSATRTIKTFSHSYLKALVNIKTIRHSYQNFRHSYQNFRHSYLKAVVDIAPGVFVLGGRGGRHVVEVVPGATQYFPSGHHLILWGAGGIGNQSWRAWGAGLIRKGANRCQGRRILFGFEFLIT